MNKWHKATKPETIDWNKNDNGTREAIFAKSGFAIKVYTQYDYDHDFTKNRGTFSAFYQAGAIRNPDTVDSNGNEYDEDYEMNWFLPAFDAREERKAYVKLGYSKGNADFKARRIAYEAMQVCIDPDRMNLYVIGVIAEVYREGVLLGESSVWGCEMKSYRWDYTKEAREEEAQQENFLNETAWDMIHEVLHEATEKLQRLQVR